MSAVHKFMFDKDGWLLLPGLLSEEQLVPIREHQLKNKYHPEELPVDQRDHHGGPSQILLDHPVVAGCLNEILSNQARADENTYGFRFDHVCSPRLPAAAAAPPAGHRTDPWLWVTLSQTGLQHRMSNKDGSRGAESNQWNPHGGGGLLNFPGNSHACKNTHIPPPQLDFRGYVLEIACVCLVPMLRPHGERACALWADPCHLGVESSHFGVRRHTLPNW